IGNKSFAARLQPADAASRPARIVWMKPGAKAQELGKLGRNTERALERMQREAGMGVAPDHASLGLDRRPRAVICVDGCKEVEAGCMFKHVPCKAAGSWPEEKGSNCGGCRCAGKHSEKKSAIG